MMRSLHERFPQYAFASHKGYCTPEHDALLGEHGPCEEHRYSFVNVRKAAARHGQPLGLLTEEPALGQDMDMPDYATPALEGVA
jgi:ribonuclease HII